MKTPFLFKKKMDRFQEHNIMVSALTHVISGATVQAPAQPQPHLQLHQFQPSTSRGLRTMAEAGSSTARGDFGLNELEIINENKQQRQKEKKKKKCETGKNYRGVRQKGLTKWVAEIWNPHKAQVVWLGTFTSAEEAARAYDRKSIEYRADKAKTNFPLSNYPELLNTVQQQQMTQQQPAVTNPNAIENNNHNTNTTGNEAMTNTKIAEAGGTSREDNTDFWNWLLEDDTVADRMVWGFPP